MTNIDINVQLKTPPHSLEAEEAVIGGLLLDSTSILVIKDKIEPNDFYKPENQEIFDCLCSFEKLGADISRENLIKSLKVKGSDVEEHARKIGHNIQSTANILLYADIIRERSVLRQLISIGKEMQDFALSEDKSPTKAKEILDKAYGDIKNIADENSLKIDC